MDFRADSLMITVFREDQQKRDLRDNDRFALNRGGIMTSGGSRINAGEWGHPSSFPRDSRLPDRLLAIRGFIAIIDNISEPFIGNPIF
jgi:hypothetical protein